MNIAIVLAAGSGKRAGSHLPKQFCEAGGKPIAAYSIESFENHPDIDEIALVVAPDYVDFARKMVAEAHWTKVKKILCGGKERSDSTRAAIAAYKDVRGNLLFHDAARPFLPAAVISRVTEALRNHEAVATAVPCVDTLLQTQNGYIAAIPDRSRLMRAQTPQAFRIECIAEAHRQAALDAAFQPTDDCGVLMHYCPNIPIYIVEGDEATFKVTYPEDFHRAEEWLKLHEE